jgi:uncharacterized protein (TIGR01777 family)
MAKILISGGSGLIGKAITKKLLALGHEVVWTGRKSGQWKTVKIYQADWRSSQIEAGVLEGVTHFILLAGAGVMDARWTAAYKEEILLSRVKTIELLAAECLRTGQWPEVLLGASATGFYGTGKSEEVITENTAPAADYLGTVCKQWESAYEAFPETVRLVKPRISIVLSKEGGAFVPLARLCRWHISAQSGDGKQYLPWIHLEDLSDFFIHALFEKQIQGPYNMVAPEIVTNAQFASELGRQLGRGIWTPAAPAFMLRLILGERAVTLTSGLKISANRLTETGFKFKYPQLAAALANLCH